MTKIVPVADYRSRIQTIPGGIEVSIPSPRNYVIAVFLVFWIGGWIFGLVGVGTQLVPGAAKGHAPPAAFLSLWFAMWTLFGIFAIAALCWLLAGREVIGIASDLVSVRREAFGIGLTRRYATRSVRALRVVETADSSGFGLFRMRDPYGMRAGPLAFDYGAKTVRFGAGADVAEAKYLLQRIIAAKPALAEQS